MNGPASIYRLNPVFTLPEKIEIPNCMYKVKKIHEQSKMETEQPACGNAVLTKILDQNSTSTSDLETRWDLVLQQLEDLTTQMEQIKSILKNQNKSQPVNNRLQELDEVVINVNPAFPPFSLLLLHRLGVPLTLTCHIHSSIKVLPEAIASFYSVNNSRGPNLTIIFKEGVTTLEVVTNPVIQIAVHGEVNLLRYLARLGCSELKYETSIESASNNDSILDLCYRLVFARTSKEKQSIFRGLNAKLGKSQYFGGDTLNIADIATWSAIKQLHINVSSELTQNMVKWFQRIDNLM